MRVLRHASRERSQPGTTCRPIREGSAKGFLLIVPFLLCAGFTVNRLLPTSTHALASSANPEGSHFTRDAIIASVEKTVQCLTGKPTRVTETNHQIIVSPTGNHLAWEMTCETEDAQYSLFLNDLTGQIYTLERTYPAPEEEVPARHEITRVEAEHRAESYLLTLGIPMPREKPTLDTHKMLPPALRYHETSWSLRYRLTQPNGHRSTVRVRLDRSTGALNYFWNAAAGL